MLEANRQQRVDEPEDERSEEAAHEGPPPPGRQPHDDLERERDTELGWKDDAVEGSGALRQHPPRVRRRYVRSTCFENTR